MWSVALQGYSTLPGYGKETLRPITIWKGNSFTTISARDPQISGKDSGKGDSDFNDSDSDISGDVHKKESPPMNSKQHRTSTITTEIVSFPPQKRGLLCVSIEQHTFLTG